MVGRAPPSWGRKRETPRRTRFRGKVFQKRRGHLWSRAQSGLAGSVEFGRPGLLPLSPLGRLISKVYGEDPLVCPACGHQMKVLAAMTDPLEVDGIARDLVRVPLAPCRSCIPWDTLFS
jgi:hypothetical protein